jgi:hypothetical protein
MTCETNDSRIQANSKYLWLWSGGLLLLLCLVGYGHLLRPGQVLYSDYSDNVAHNLAGMSVLYESLQKGEGLPMWRSDQMVGWPATTQPQALYTYPLHILFWFMSPQTALGWVSWLHILAAGLVFLLFGSVLRLGWGARLIMAVAGMFQFKLVMALYAGWLPMMPSLVLTPLLFVVVFDAIQRPRWISMLWMAGVGGLCLHCGHLQMFYYTVLFLFGYLVFCAVRWWWRRQWLDGLKILGGLGAGALLATAISAYLLIPLWLDAPLTSRTAISYDHFLAGNSLQWRNFLTLFFPEALGTPVNGSYESIELWEDVAYFGLIPLVLAVIGIMCGWRRRFVGFLAIIFGLALFILPMDTPLLRFLYNYAPGFSLFRAPTRMLFLVSSLGIVLAGVGWDVISTWLHKLGYRRSQIAVTGLLIGIISFEGSFYAHRYLTTRAADQVIPKSEYQVFLANQPKPFRIAPLGRFTLNAGWANFMDLEIITGYEPYNYRHYQEYISLLQDGYIRPRPGAVWTDLNRITRIDLLNLLNAKYLLSPVMLELPAPSPFVLRAKFVAQPVFKMYQGLASSDLFLYQNLQAKSRAYFPDQVAVVTQESEMYKLMHSQQLGKLAIALCAPPRHNPQLCLALAKYQSEQTKDAAQIEIISWQAGNIRLRTNSHTPRFLHISEIWHPGWSAQIGQHAIPLYRTNGSLLGLWIPKGTYEISLRFLPPSWTWATRISFLALLAWLCLCALAWWFGRRHKSPD